MSDMKKETEALADFRFLLKQNGLQGDLIEPINSLMVKAYLSGYNSANEWVKCSDRLPEDKSVTLVTYHGVVCTARLFEVTHQWYSSYANGFVNPTHWMPLPTPPTT